MMLSKVTHMVLDLVPHEVVHVVGTKIGYNKKEVDHALWLRNTYPGETHKHIFYPLDMGGVPL